MAARIVSAQSSVAERTPEKGRLMQSIVVFLLFIGMLMVVHGIYDEKLRALKDNVRVEYRFIPRTYYEEQLAGADLMGTYKNMFERDSPWLGRQ